MCQKLWLKIALRRNYLILLCFFSPGRFSPTRSSSGSPTPATGCTSSVMPTSWEPSFPISKLLEPKKPIYLRNKFLLCLFADLIREALGAVIKFFVSLKSVTKKKTRSLFCLFWKKNWRKVFFWGSGLSPIAKKILTSILAAVRFLALQLYLKFLQSYSCNLLLLSFVTEHETKLFFEFNATPYVENQISEMGVYILSFLAWV